MLDCAKKTIQWEGIGGLYKVGKLCGYVQSMDPYRRNAGRFDKRVACVMLEQVFWIILDCMHALQGVTSPLAGQMFFRASLFSAFGASKRWLGTDADGNARQLTASDFYKVHTARVVLKAVLHDHLCSVHVQQCKPHQLQNNGFIFQNGRFVAGWSHHWIHCSVHRGAHRFLQVTDPSSNHSFKS